MVRRVAFIACALVVLTACGGDDGDAAETTAASTTTTVAPATTTTTTIPSVTAAGLCAAPAPVQIGALQEPELVELSGLETDERTLMNLIAHNDSGDSPRYFSFAPDGDPKTTVDIGIGVAFALDWEDMTATDASLYFGDIGDNFKARSSIVVYGVDNDPAPAEAEADVFELTYPDGAHDAEALMADPVDGNLVIVTKETTGASGVYVRPLDTSGPLELAATLALGDGQLVTAGDISTDGRVIVLRTYTSVLVWDREPGETLSRAFARPPCSAPAPTETQGEAITLVADGYITIGEGAGAPIWRVIVPPAP